VDYKGRMLIMMGGEGISDKRSPLLYNDTWIFDLKNKIWSELLIDNRTSFRPRSNFTANIHKNTIYIFGGFINLSNFKCTDELVTLTLH
jgi:N-acetylneuraminic acid mutarotase